jgi:hypothetical protein
MLKKLALLAFLVLCSVLLVLYDMQKDEKNRAFDKGTAVWHE